MGLTEEYDEEEGEELVVVVAIAEVEVDESEDDTLLSAARATARMNGSGAIAPRTGGEMNMASEIREPLS